MPRVGFEPMIPAFEWEKKVHALDRAAIVIGNILLMGEGERKSIIWLAGSRVTSARPSVTSSTKVKALIGLEVVT
jgi:hypothetical protein